MQPEDEVEPVNSEDSHSDSEAAQTANTPEDEEGPEPPIEDTTDAPNQYSPSLGTAEATPETPLQVEEGPPTLPPGVGTSQPLTTTPKEKRVPGACMLTSFVPLQLVAHLDQGNSCGKPVIIYDNERCNSVLSGTVNFDL